MMRPASISRVAVLAGGFSKEREISLVSGNAAARALKAKGLEVTFIDLTRDMAALVATLERAKPDVVFNALHGRFGEDGCIQGLLDMMRIPYTNSGRLASAVWISPWPSACSQRPAFPWPRNAWSRVPKPRRAMSWRGPTS